MSSATTYAESVASCRAPAPLGSPLPAAAAAVVPDAFRLPVRRPLDFPGGGGGNLDDDDDFLFRAAEEMERSLYAPMRRAVRGLTPTPPVAPPTFPEKQCICGRGPCDVVWKEPGRWWAYVCSATPKCNDYAWCEESDIRPNSQPAFWSHPEANNPRTFNTPSNHRAGATTRVNINSQGAGATIPVNVSPQDAGATTPVNFRPEGARSNGEWQICMCTAGKCRILKLKGIDYYVCPIPKGQGACAHRELVNACAEEPLTGYKNQRESGHNYIMTRDCNENRPFNPNLPPEYDEWPFDIVEGDVVPKERLAPAHPTSTAVVARGSPILLHQPVAVVDLETPRKSPMPPKYTISPTTPLSGGCFRCHEEGHWAVNCPKKDACFHCGLVGHWRNDCPGLQTK